MDKWTAINELKSVLFKPGLSSDTREALQYSLDLIKQIDSDWNDISICAPPENKWLRVRTEDRIGNHQYLSVIYLIYPTLEGLVGWVGPGFYSMNRGRLEFVENVVAWRLES